MDSTLPGSSVYGIFLAGILEGVAISSSRGSSQPSNQTHVSDISCLGRWFLYHWHHLGSPYHLLFPHLHIVAHLRQSRIQSALVPLGPYKRWPLLCHLLLVPRLVPRLEHSRDAPASISLPRVPLLPRRFLPSTSMRALSMFVSIFTHFIRTTVVKVKQCI